jgi:16S rRNA (guanine966-N2)-methyltransferase
MRIVAGRFRGRALAAPAGHATRPTSDRVREAVFNVLGHGAPALDLTSAPVLDLFAGSGALAFEALSRGAPFATLVEEDAEARGAIRQNIEALGLTGHTRVLRRDATQLGPAGRFGSAGLCFIDPPYGRGLGEKALAEAIGGGWLVAGAIVVLEEAAEVTVHLPAGATLVERRAWGGTAVHFARIESLSASSDETDGR